MGTRSRIGFQTENGAVYSIYCHWDGYPSHNGRILEDHYADEEKVRELMELGDLSILGPNIGEKCDFDNCPDDQCVAYGRDRGEPDTEHAVDDTPIEFFKRAAEGWEEFVYLHRNGLWHVSRVGGGAGPMLVDARDPEGVLPADWKLVHDVLRARDPT